MAFPPEIPGFPLFIDAWAIAFASRWHRGNMDDNSSDRLTLAHRFLEPSNSTHRQYEALRAFFVDRLPSAEVAARFGYTPASFRVLVHHFRNQPDRDFFLATPREGR